MSRHMHGDIWLIVTRNVISITYHQIPIFQHTYCICVRIYLLPMHGICLHICIYVKLSYICIFLHTQSFYINTRICARARVCMRMRVCACVCVRVRMRARVCARAYVYVYVCAYACMRIYARACVYVSAHMCPRVYIGLCKYSREYMYGHAWAH